MRSVLVTGGSAGIGRATVDRFLAEGWLVGAYSRRGLPGVSHPSLVSGVLDVQEPDSWSAALEDFASHTGGGLDVLVNNAGVIVAKDLADMSVSDILTQIQVNAAGPTLGAHLAYPYLRKGHDPQVVNLGSASAIYGQPDISVYGATKAYLGSLTEALNLEWRSAGIRVVDVWPLWTQTAMAECEATSVARMGAQITPERVAEVVWAAANPKNRWQRGKIHYGVSPRDKALYVGRKLSPDRLSRSVNGWLSR